MRHRLDGYRMRRNILERVFARKFQICVTLGLPNKMKTIQQEIQSLKKNDQQKRTAPSHQTISSLFENGFRKWDDLKFYYESHRHTKLTNAKRSSFRHYKSLFSDDFGYSLVKTANMGFGIQVTADKLNNTKGVISGLYAYIENSAKDPQSLIILNGGTEVNLSGPAYFLNHSCDPNSIILTQPIIEHGRRVYPVKILGKTLNSTLSKGDWITIDYGPEYFLENGKIKLMCLCGSKNCRTSNPRLLKIDNY